MGGFWRRFEQAVWMGPVLKDYGSIGEMKVGPSRERVSAVLAHRDGRVLLILKAQFGSFPLVSVNYLELDHEMLRALEVVVQDALALLDEPPSRVSEDT